MIEGILCQTKKRVRSILKNLKLEFKQMVARLRVSEGKGCLQTIPSESRQKPSKRD